MKVLALVAGLVPLATAQAAKYDVSWTVVGEKCTGDVELGEFLAASNGCASSCEMFAQNAAFSLKGECQVDFTGASRAAFGSAAYVLTQYYDSGAGCKGDALTVIAVRNDGECYPNQGFTRDKNGTLIKAVKVSATEGGNVSISHFSDQSCAEPIASYSVSGANGEACQEEFMKSVVMEPASGSSSGTVMTSEPKAMGPGSSEGSSSEANATVTEAPTPSTTSGGSSIGYLTAISVATVAGVASML